MKIKKINPKSVLYVETNEEVLNTYFRHSQKKWSIYNVDYRAGKYAQELEEALQDYIREQDIACQDSKGMPE